MTTLERIFSAPGNQCQLPKMMQWILALIQFQVARRMHSILKNCKQYEKFGLLEKALFSVHVMISCVSGCFENEGQYRRS